MIDVEVSELVASQAYQFYILNDQPVVVVM
jgi:hypothetical protein